MAVTTTETDALVFTIHQDLPDHRIISDFTTSPMPTLVKLAGSNDAGLDSFFAAVVGYNTRQHSLLVAVPRHILGTDEPKILEFEADGDDYVCTYTPDSGGEGGRITVFDVSTNLITQGSDT